MKAIRFDTAFPRNGVGRALMRLAPEFMVRLGQTIGALYPPLLWSGLLTTYLQDIPEPPLPNDEWVKIKTRYGGICGSDTSRIHLQTSPYYSPLASLPHTFGHESVGTIAELGARVKGWQVGERVVVEPALWCRPRGFAELCRFCARGEINLCERVTQGILAPGLIIGSCRDTGGSWSPYFVAHESQLYRVPENVSDENALLVEPFAVSLHPALQNLPHDEETVLIVGAGSIGLLILAALRALGCRSYILVLARYLFQADAARKLGASEVISERETSYLAEIAKRTDGSIYQPLFGKPLMLGGGVDRTFECVGSDSSIDESLRMTRNAGRVVLVGVPVISKAVEWNTIFVKELDLRAAYIYNHAENYNGRKARTYDIALDLMRSGKVDLGWLVTHRFRVEEYGRALSLLSHRRDSQVIKAVFEFDK